LKVHQLKTWPEYFARVWSGGKRAELRRDDRHFAVDDHLVLMEWDPASGEYSGREVEAVITDIIRDAPGFGLAEGFVVLSLTCATRRYGELGLLRRQEPTSS
jgi:hypothetical protein